MQASLTSRSRRVDIALWILTFLSAGLTLLWSFGPAPVRGSLFPGADKLWHALAYLLTSFLLFLAAVWRPGRGPGPFYGYRLVIAMTLAIAGGMVEVAQGVFTTDRTADFLDWAAEILAVAAAYGAVMWMRDRAESA